MNSTRADWRTGGGVETDAAGEVQSLRRTLRDVVALSALPSIWVDYDLPRSLQNLTDVLRAALRAYTVCIRVKLPDGSSFSTAASNGLSTEAAPLCDTVEVLDAAEVDSTELIELTKFNRSGPLSALAHPLFFNGQRIGHFAACYKADVIPSQSDRLLLQVAANQVILLFQRHRDQEERFARKLAEDRLRQAEHHYQQLVQSLPAAVYTTDSEGRITLYNEAAAKLWGRRPKIGEDLWCGSWKIFRPDGSPMPLDECPMAIAIREGRSVRGQEIVVERPDGTRAWVLPHPDPIRAESGKIVGFVNMLVQIDELKRAEQAAKASEARIQSLLTLMPAAVYVCDAEGRITFYNRRAVELWGWEPRLNYDQQKFCAMHKCWFNGKQIPPDETPMAVAVREGKAFRNLEPTIERPDGTRLSVLVNIDPFFDSHGKPAGAINVFQDVTPLKRAQEELKSREEHLRAVVENTPECVKLVAEDGTLLAMNGAGLCMVEADAAEHVIGKNVYDIIAPEYRDAFRAMNERVCAGKKERLEFEIIGLKGTRRWMETHAAPIIDPASGRTVQIAVTRDVTERRKGELELRRKNEQLAAFLETAALGLHRVGPDGIILWANDAEMKMLGYSPEEYIGHHIAEFHADQRVIDDILKRLSCGETLCEREARLRCKDGSIKHVLIDSSVLWEDSKFIHTQCFTRDITDRKRAEESLREKKALLEAQKDAFQAAMGGSSLEESLEVLVHRVIEFTGGRARAAFYIARPDGKALHHVIGMPEHYAKAVDNFPISAESMACGLAVHTGRPEIAVDVEQDPKWEAYRWLARHHNFRACWSFPVRTKDSAANGTMAMYFQEPCAPTLRELEMATVIAHAATVIISRHQQLSERERAEQALQLSSRLPAENPAPVLRVSREKRLHYANPKAQEFLSEWQVRVGDPVPATILELIGGGDRHDAEITMGERCYSVAVAPVLNGEFINLYFTDITDRKRTEQKLRETNERLKKVLEVETVGVMFWDLKTGCLVDANDTFLNMMGYSRADVESRTLTWEKFTPPEYRDISRAEIAKFASTGRVGPYEKEYFHKDGTRQWLLFAGSSLGNNQVVEFCVDISDRKRAEESAARLAAIVEHSDDAIFSTDLDGLIKTWNTGAQRLYGYRPEEVIGKAIALLVPEDRRDEESRLLARIREGHTVENCETVRRRKDGSVFDVSLTISPVKDAKGNVIGVSKVARDISDKVRAREKLEHTIAERTARLRDTVAELEAFSYSVAHDMRAPLRAMNSYSRLLEDEFAQVLPPEAKNFTRRIAAGASRLDSLITDVLNYSKIARGEMALETVDVEKLTRDIVDSYPSLSETHATILVQSSIPPVVGNTAALTQCISNLLSNAIKFVASGTTPCVIIRAERKSDYVRLWFEDNGIGISEEGQQRIFRMFQRLNPATAFEGTGIGLTIVRKAVERMGGRVGVESRPGAGSQFWIELKRAA